MKVLRLKIKKDYEKLAFSIVLILVSILYFSRYWNRMLPYSEGWGLFYSDMLSDGKVPYRDFYYYLPPLNLIIDFVLWKLSFGYLIIYRAWRFVERIYIILLTYHLLCKVAKPRYASFAAFLGSVICAATVFDLLGDYNQTCDLVVLLLCWCLTKYADAFQKSCWRKECFYLFISGFVIGISFLLKQNVFVAEVIVFFLVLTVLFLIKKKSGYICSVLTTIGGCLIPILAAVVILACQKALIPYIEQAYLDTSAKGGVLDIIFSPLSHFTMNEFFLVAIIVGGILCLYKLSVIQCDVKKKILLTVIIYFYFFGAVMFLYGNELRIAGSAIVSVSKAACAIAFSVFLLIRSKKREKLVENVQMLAVFGVLALVIMFVSFKVEYAERIYYTTSAFSLVGKLSYYFILAGFAVLLYLLYSYAKTGSKQTLLWILFVSGGLVSAYTSIMACGTSDLNNRSIVILFPVLLLFLLEKPVYLNRMKNLLLIMAGVLVCTICMAQKISNTYAWWGWENAPICVENNEIINVPGLKGFRVSPDVKTLYEEMYRVVNENTDEDSVIYGFPHVKLFNVLCKNSNMSGFVPIPFYDVCGDNYAKQEAVLLKQSAPDIVIWCDIVGCMETHEMFFRNGEPLGQRDIQSWFSKAVIKGEYELIGQYDILYVYKRVDGCSPAYTYFQNDGSRNSTLLTAEALNMVAEFFTGDGSEETPFLIRDEEDLLIFRSLVNSGCSFDNTFFRQTADLDFSDYDVTVAIGRYGTDTCFNGMYDAAGHVIAGLHVKEETDTGLFGVLGGTVKNLTLRDSVISGECCGGIASHAASSEAKIINCIIEETVQLNGWRVGGIVDSFVGGLINCESAASVESFAAQPTGKLYSYYVGYMINCVEK